MLRLKGNKGITLIALVITIIVLLILAGVTIAQITGQDSAPQKASEAKKENDAGAARDEATMLAAKYVQEYMDKKYVQRTDLTSKVQDEKLEVGENGDSKYSVSGVELPKNLADGETLPATAGEYVAEQFRTRASNESKYNYEVDGMKLTIKDKTSDEELATGTIMDDGVIKWGEDTVSKTSVWRGLASEDETHPNLFKYKILTEPETAKVEEVQELGKVADNTGTVKISKNKETSGTCCIINTNWDYLANDLNIAYKTSYGWYKLKKDVELPSYITKIVIPEKVRLDEEGNLNENGKLYTVTCFGNPDNGANGLFDDLTVGAKEVVFPSTITTITNHQWIDTETLYLPPNLNSTPYVERCTNVYFTGGVFPTAGDIGNDGGKDCLTFVSFDGEFNFDENSDLSIFGGHDYTDLSVKMNVKGMKKLPSWLFAYAQRLNEVVLGDSVEELTDCSMYSCRMNKLVLPKNLKKIDENCFSYDTTIGEVHFEGTEEDFTSISNYEKLYDVTDTIYVNGQLWEIPRESSSSSSSSSSSNL